VSSYVAIVWDRQSRICSGHPLNATLSDDYGNRRRSDSGMDGCQQGRNPDLQAETRGCRPHNREREAVSTGEVRHRGIGACDVASAQRAVQRTTDDGVDQCIPITAQLASGPPMTRLLRTMLAGTAEA
jgi:hypothetical protein